MAVTPRASSQFIARDSITPARPAIYQSVNFSSVEVEGVEGRQIIMEDSTAPWSRRITDEHRLVYRVIEGRLEIAQCRYHY